MFEIPVREIFESGRAWVHVFKTPNGQEIDVLCSENEYRFLGTKGAGQPKNGVNTWLYSAERVTWDVGIPKKDDVLQLPGGHVVIYNGKDPYRGGLLELLKEDYSPSLEVDLNIPTGKKLVTSKQIPVANVLSKLDLP